MASLRGAPPKILVVHNLRVRVLYVEKFDGPSAHSVRF